MARKLRIWLISAFFVYIAGGLALYFLQDAILFHPVSLKRSHKYEFREPHEDLSIGINENDTLNLVRFLATDSVKRGVVLYFHGNRKNIGWYAKYTPYFTSHGYEVIIIDYPGFGKSIGKFNEQTLYNWSEQVYKLANRRFQSDSIIIYGKSMGTGIAARLASRVQCKRLILETPYFDLPSVISHYLPIYPVSRMLHYELPTHRFLPAVQAPITIFHGTDDGVITYSNSSRLKPMLKSNDEFITIDGGSHNDLFEYKEMVAKLDSLLK